jgi:U3 small nucleolar RNA-associated protein 3
MAKRKRGQSQAQVEPQNEEDFYNTADSKLKIRTYEDIADSEDDFHAGRDEVLLDKARGGKRRKQEEGKL